MPYQHLEIEGSDIPFIARGGWPESECRPAIEQLELYDADVVRQMITGAHLSKAPEISIQFPLTSGHTKNVTIWLAQDWLSWKSKIKAAEEAARQRKLDSYANQARISTRVIAGAAILNLLATSANFLWG